MCTLAVNSNLWTHSCHSIRGALNLVTPSFQSMENHSQFTRAVSLFMAPWPSQAAFDRYHHSGTTRPSHCKGFFKCSWRMHPFCLGSSWICHGGPLMKITLQHGAQNTEAGNNIIRYLVSAQFNSQSLETCIIKSLTGNSNSLKLKSSSSVGFMALASF